MSIFTLAHLQSPAKPERCWQPRQAAWALMCQGQGWSSSVRLQSLHGSSARRCCYSPEKIFGLWVIEGLVDFKAKICSCTWSCRWLTLSFQEGRAGRGGDQSVCVLLRRKGERTPPEMREFLNPNNPNCLKKGMETVFTLKSPDGEILIIHVQIQLVFWTFTSTCQHSCVRHRGGGGGMQRSLHCGWMVHM